MKTYIMAFIFYTLAMIGVMFAGFIVYKKTMLTTAGKKKGSMRVLESLAIAPKKMLMIVKVEKRKFLIASDAENTTFLADLTDEEIIENNVVDNQNVIPIEKFENDKAVNAQTQQAPTIAEGTSRKKMMKKILENLKSTEYGKRSRF